VAQGSSSPDEAQMLALKPRMAGAVLEFAAVSEAEKAWLFRRARLALYPTVHEGFGLVPFESADYGVPCLWAPGTALSEVLPDPAAAIVPWNAAETADAAHRLMRDETARQRNLEAIRRSAVGLTWDATAAHLVELYRQTCDAASAPTGAVERKSGLLTGTLSEDAIRLIGPGGALPSDVERPLLALATHRQFATPMFGVMKVGYRASYRLRRRLRRNGKSN
jgi:hypothetical protein